MTNATDALRDALYNLRELTQCRCHPAFTDRGRVDPDCNHEYRDDVEALDAALAEARRGAEAWRQFCEAVGAQQAVDASAKFGDALGLVRDAERYRWLRERELTVSRHNLVPSDQSAALDAHIDAAMGSANGQG